MDRACHFCNRLVQRTCFIIMVIVFIVATTLLVLAHQYAAIVLLPLILLLMRAIHRRDQQTRALVERITDERQTAKVEVPHGNSGGLARAVNSLLHDRRVAQQMRATLPTPLPITVVQSLLGDTAGSGGQSRAVVVLLVGAPVRIPIRDQGVSQASLQAWRTFAAVTQEVASRFAALIQPCGDAVMLVFGAFEQRSTRESLRDALAAATQIQADWRASSETANALALVLASGHALTAVLPGLGFCVVGAPIDHAVGLQQLATRARRSGLLCSEESYQLLSHTTNTTWQATDLRISIANRPPQTVYQCRELPAKKGL